MHYLTGKMEVINVREDQMSDFYQAAWRGDAETLVNLLQRDVTILANISDGRQTPLHISALLDHVPLTEVFLNHDRSLDIRVDSSGRTALHLASAEGHLKTVQKLLECKNEPCLVRDEEGRNPLHYAVMRGRKKVVQELIKARPESLSLGDGEENTVFHLCVMYNYLKILETLVKLDYATANIIAGQSRGTIFTRPDRVGNTILHLAIMFKRVEVVSYLMTIPEIREIANVKNNIGFIAQDMLEQSPKDFKSCEIQHMLTMAGRHPRPPPQTSKTKCVRNFLMKIFRWIDKWSKSEEEWLKEMRGNLSLVSTVIATISFQALINPPGGFIQQGLSSKEDTAASSNDPLSCTTLNDNQEYCPGQAMAASFAPPDYKKHLVCVTISFFSSLSVTLLLVSGIFPLKNRAVIWMLSIGMCITLTSLAAAYISAINIIIPIHLLEEGLIGKMKEVVFARVWCKLLGIIVLLITLRFVIWVVKKCNVILKKSRRWWRENRRCKFLIVLFTMIVIFVMLLLFCALSFVVRLVFLILGY